MASAIVFACWFSAACLLIHGADGLRPVTFITPDEAANRLAALNIRKTGQPFLQLPFPDPEDVAHPRAWYSVDDKLAIPVYPPVSVYAYALLTFLGNFGYFLIIAWPASGLAAFAAGAARLLPDRRKWLGLLAPALGAPALYWSLRPWMNISLLLACLGWSFCAWTVWRERGNTRWLAVAFAWVGAAAAVRPDYTAYVLPIAALFSVAAQPRAYRRILVMTFLAGLAALIANLVLNHLITGHAFRAAYQLAIEREEGMPTGPRWLALVKTLLFPMGLPTLSTLGFLLYKYWIGLPALLGLLLAQLSLLPLMKEQSRVQRVLNLAALVLAVLFMLSRMDRGLYGGNRPEGLINDSVPRYWTPMYLFAGLPPLLLLGRVRGVAPLVAGALLVAALSGASIHTVLERRLRDAGVLREEQRALSSLSSRLAKDDLVYTPAYDKVLWSHCLIADAEDPEKTAKSMTRAIRHHFSVFLWLSPRYMSHFDEFEDALQRRRLRLKKIDRKLHFYRVHPVSPPVER